jgi:carboxyl-terminal processing protease
MSNGDEVNSLISELGKMDVTSDAFWVIVRQIESKVKADAINKVREGLKSSDIKIRLGCARIVYQAGLRDESVKHILSILLIPVIDKEIFFTAAELLGNLVCSDRDTEAVNRIDLAKSVVAILDVTLDAYRRLSLAKLWYDLERSSLAVKEVKEIANLKDSQIKIAAALVLAGMKEFEKSTEILNQVSLDPTPSGRLAKALLEVKTLQDAYFRKETSKPDAVDYRVLDEVLKLIREKYVDPSAYKEKELITAAAKGIAGTLDAYSEYQDEEQKRRALESIAGKYGGIGAHVSMRDNYLTIERPMYGQPAYKAGLRTLDRITEIEGESTFRKDLDELVKRLKGDPGTDVKIKVFRRGWQLEREFVISRAIINVQSAKYEILPGNIGYLLITSFSSDTAKEVKQSLDEMNKQNIKALIVDVRRNPGGLLDVVNRIVDFFIDGGKTIVSIRERNQIVEEYRTKDDDKIDISTYVIIDEGSASASEIFAGVLQDYKKATLIGNTTYGKGSVQRPFDLESTEKKTILKLTIAAYYLPSGRSIHKKDKKSEGGVAPDIKITPSERDPGKESEFTKLLDSGELDKYYEKYYDKNKVLFSSLAEDDGEDYERYPDFEQWYQGLKVRLEPDEVRQALREHIRRKLADDRGKEFLVDIQSDLVLQRTIIEVCRSEGVKINPATIPVYKRFAHKFDKEKENSAK